MRIFDEVMSEINKGAVKNRVDLSDLSCCSLYLFGMHRDDAFYITKCKGMIADSTLAERAKAYLTSERIMGLLDAMLPIIQSKKEVAAGVEGYSMDWRNMEIEALSTEEVEKMGTFLLRNAAMAKDIDAKEINDLMKMLDSVGALPKKKQTGEDLKQVIINIPYNDVCVCGREIYNPNKDANGNDNKTE